MKIRPFSQAATAETSSWYEENSWWRETSCSLHCAHVYQQHSMFECFLSIC